MTTTDGRAGVQALSADDPDAADVTDQSTSEGLPGSSPAGRRFVPERALGAFLLLAVSIGSLLAMITPPMFGPDESSHIARVWSLTDGVIISDDLNSSPAPGDRDTIPTSLDGLGRYMTEIINDPPVTPFPQIAEPLRVEALEAAPLLSPPVPTSAIFSGALTYTPVAYLPHLAGMAVAKTVGLSIGATIDLMRLFGVLTYALLVGAAIAVLREHRARWLVFVAGLIPMSLFQAATVTADTMTLGLSILIGALVLKAVFLRRELSSIEGVGLFAAAVLLPLSKAGYVNFLLVAILVPAALLPGRRLGKAGGALILTVGALVLAWWTRRTTVAVVAERAGGLVAPDRQVAFVLDHPLTFARIVANTFSSKGVMYFTQFFGDLGFTFVSIPALATVAVILAAVVAFGNAERVRAPIGSTVAVVVVVLAGIASVFGALYLNFSPVGYYIIDGVQGRYFLPFVLLVLGVLLRFVPLRWHLPTPRDVRACEMSVVGLAAAALVLAAVKYYFVIWV